MMKRMYKNLWNGVLAKRKNIAFLLSISLLTGLFAVRNTGVAAEEVAISNTDIATGPAITVEPSATASGGSIATDAPVETPIQTESPKPVDEPTASPVTGGAITVKAVTKNQTETIFVAQGTKASTCLQAEIINEEDNEPSLEMYEFQWYQKTGKVWDAIEGGNTSEYQALVKKKGTTQYYCVVCDKNTQQEWKSNKVTVIGYKKNISITLGEKATTADIFGTGFDSSSIKNCTVVNGYNNSTIKKTAPKAYKKYHKLNYKKYISVSKKYAVTVKKYCEKGQLKVKSSSGQSFQIQVTVKLPKPKMVLKLSKNKKILTGYYKKNTVKNAAYMKIQFMSVKQKKYISWSSFSNKFRDPKKTGKFVNATKLKIKKYRVRAVYKTDFGTKKSGWTMLCLK